MTQPAHCDLLYSCNKFRLKPAKLREGGRAGYFNGESNIGRRKGTILFGETFVLQARRSVDYAHLRLHG